MLSASSASVEAYDAFSLSPTTVVARVLAIGREQVHEHIKACEPWLEIAHEDIKRFIHCKMSSMMLSASLSTVEAYDAFNLSPIGDGSATTFIILDGMKK